jgi:hypothetical protein
MPASTFQVREETIMEKKELKKLSLSKETLRSLDEQQLKDAIGASGPTALSFCKSCVNSNCCSG